MLFTILGFLVIKLFAFLILSGNITRQEIGSLMAPISNNAQRQKPTFIYVFSAIFGIAMLVAAYLLAIQGIAWQKSSMMLLTLSLGILGTILLFRNDRIAAAGDIFCYHGDFS